MKKILVIGLILAMLVTVIAGCGTKDTSEPTATPAATATPAPTSTPSTETSLKTGLSVVTSVSNSKNAGEEDGLAQANTVIIAVTLDSAGVIQDCAIDYVQAKINFNAEGKLTKALETVFPSKRELGDDYGMKAVSGIGKEWYEQADALEAYVIGKTVDQVKGIALDDSGHATDAELTSSVTIGLGDYISGIEKAVANAVDLGAMSGDKIGIGTTATMSSSKDATDEANGLAQSYVNISVVTVDGSGKVTSCIVDAVQANVNFTKAGVIETDLTSKPMTKLELGEGYGMKKASAIGKEWNEQANAFAAYVTGKTLDEIKGIAVDETGVATDAELTSSVTVHVSPFIANIEKAVKAAG